MAELIIGETQCHICESKPSEGLSKKRKAHRNWHFDVIENKRIRLFDSKSVKPMKNKSNEDFPSVTDVKTGTNESDLVRTFF